MTGYNAQARTLAEAIRIINGSAPGDPDVAAVRLLHVIQFEAQQACLGARAAQAGTQEDGAAYGDGDLQCSACLSHITSTYAVAYGDGYLCPACASEALAAVPVSAIAYLMADIAPADAADAQKLHESRAAVTAWLESLEAEED